MTIEFNCPQCKALIAFPDKHAGKRAKCLTCRQRLIIPAHSGEVPTRVAPEPVDRGDPLPGFYRAAFVSGWRLFFMSESLTGLVLVTAAVGFKFFAGHTDYSVQTPGFNILMPTGLLITLGAWGILFWYYCDVIMTATFEGDQLAELTLGDGAFGVLWSIIKGLWIFALGLILVLIPYGIGMAFQIQWVSTILHDAGLLLFPMVILTFGVNRDVVMLARVDQMVRPVLKALGPYLSVAVLFLAVWQLQLLTRNYGDLKDPAPEIVALHLAVQLAVQVLVILVMRGIGLFYKHYACHFAW